MLRRERGQVAAEYVGMLLLVAVIDRRARASPARRSRSPTARRRPICQIAGGDCARDAGPSRSTARRVERAATDLRAPARLRRGRTRAAVASFFEDLDPAVAEALAHEHPELVGNLDGAPIGLRYTANAEAIKREIARLRADGVPTPTRAWPSCSSFDDPDRHFLLFDPAGDGRAAEVFGDLTTARHVAVVVPGMNNDLEQLHGRGRRESVQHQASQFDPDQVATIQWLGYDTPEGASRARRRHAEPGAEDAAAVRRGHPRRSAPSGCTGP